MARLSTDILSVLDACCDSFAFPMLDNGYVYLAATRLSLFRSTSDWAIVTEVFGFSTRSGVPDTHISTFASCLHNRKSPRNFVTREAYDNYLKNNPNNESTVIFPTAEGEWQNPEDSEVIADGVTEISLRGQIVHLPSREEYSDTAFRSKTRMLYAFSRHAVSSLPSTATQFWLIPTNAESMFRLNSKKSWCSTNGLTLTSWTNLNVPAGPKHFSNLQLYWLLVMSSTTAQLARQIHTGRTGRQVEHSNPVDTAKVAIRADLPRVYARLTISHRPQRARSEGSHPSFTQLARRRIRIARTERRTGPESGARLARCSRVKQVVSWHSLIGNYYGRIR